MLEGVKVPISSPLYPKALEWIRNFPGTLDDTVKENFRQLIKSTFDITEDELRAELAGVALVKRNQASAKEIENELYRLIPKRGLLHLYAEYTEHSEAPLAYHLFCILVTIGAIINRRVSFNMGYYRLFPNISVILIGPSGIKKTSAANIAVSILQELQLARIYSEKLTPEQLVEAMVSDAKGLLYAPEMSVFLGKQRYNEGLVPLVTRFLDCPDLWASETIMRGKRQLTDIALSSLMCTTPDWFISNTPEDTFGGGFIARNLLIVQNESPRVEPVPRPGSPTLRQEVMAQLARVHQLEGELYMPPDCRRTYEDWYTQEKFNSVEPESELLATYYQRKPDHVKRLAMNIHMSEHFDLCLCVECFNRALAILNWTEKFLPAVLRKMFKTASGREHDFVLRAIQAEGGIIDHSLLLRKVQYKLNAQQLRVVLLSLKESNQVGEQHDQLQHVWYIKETL